MIRGGSSSRRIARLFGCAVVAMLIAAPASASAQSAVDEYTLDIPGAGSGSGDPTSPTGGAPGAAAAGGESGRSPSEEAREKQLESRGLTGEQVHLQFAPFHSGLSGGLDTSPRSAPEVIADSLFDPAMLPILAGLALITGFCAWRALRGRWTPTGGAGSPTGEAG